MPLDAPPPLLPRSSSDALPLIPRLGSRRESNWHCAQLYAHHARRARKTIPRHCRPESWSPETTFPMAVRGGSAGRCPSGRARLLWQCTVWGRLRCWSRGFCPAPLPLWRPFGGLPSSPSRPSSPSTQARHCPRRGGVAPIIGAPIESRHIEERGAYEGIADQCVFWLPQHTSLAFILFIYYFPFFPFYSCLFLPECFVASLELQQVCHQ